MPFLKKLAFWKHEEEAPEVPPLAPEEKPFPKLSASPDQLLEPSFLAHPFTPPSAGLQPHQNIDAELRVISAKLDTVKALLDVINQRLDRLEGKKGEELVKWR